MTSGQPGSPGTRSLQNVEPGSYTALRLEHASAEHIHLTTRRCFIGPIPEGWLKSHRKSWYKQYLGLSTYSSRAATFSAKPGISHHRQITGLDGPSASATFGHSFPQPVDVDEDDEGGDGSGEDEETSEHCREEVGDNVTEVESIALETEAAEPATPSPVDEPPNPRAKRRPTFKERLHPKESKQSPSTSSFVTAPMKQKPKKDFKSRLAPIDSAQGGPSSSFVTAEESMKPLKDSSKGAKDGDNVRTTTTEVTPEELEPSAGSPGTALQPRPSNFDSQNYANGTNSTASLLPHAAMETDGDGDSPFLQAGDSTTLPAADQGQKPQAVRNGLVKFNLVDQTDGNTTRTTTQVAQAGRRRSWKRFRRNEAHPGEIVKMEKMLVRADSTLQQLPADYNENDSLKTEARTVEKWREFVVVCRESTTEDADFSIQMYKTRVIPAKEETHVQKRSTHEIPLSRATTRVNLYSSLDKTLVIWVPWKMGTIIYILRTRSAASAVEWYTFIRNTLGWQRSTSLQVNVPDLSVTLQLENPFGELEASMNAAQLVRSDSAVITKTMEAERAVASTIIQRSLKMLENNPEWADVLESWLAKEKIGLAWKRYDRLEWVHGANEQKMYGTLAMERTHELELRPKDHYPTAVRPKNKEPLDEPAPIEGFLIRLTSQKGHVRRLGKMYFKRLYFTTHNQFLCYCKPAKALPPPPSELPLSEGYKLRSKNEILDQTPLIFAVNPFPNKDGEIEWLREGNPVRKARHDEYAYKEAERRINTMLHAEGYIDLSHVVRVQNIQRGNSPADANVEQGPDVDFHEEVEDTTRDDGQTDQFDDDRTFELVMENKLVIRLQAYNEVTKIEWISRLRKLVHYWKLRLADDMNLLKIIRGLNLKRLEIDEQSEARIGQFGSKWEVTRSVASPKLFNMCGIACCRTITLSGVLYRKPKLHSTFQRCGVILCHGNLLIFHGTLRQRTGKEVRHIQHERQSSIDLKSCYIYSGLVTEGDLLYQNQTFDSNHPGHHALPRVYLEDGWTSTDEDSMTCFVIWQPRSKSMFKSSEEEDSGKSKSRLRYVSRLGVPGRGIVFKARSRAERDHWVMSISLEIDRSQGGEDIRVVDKKH